MSKIFKFIGRHKIASAIIIVALAGGGYYGYQKIYGNKSVVQYVTAAVEKGTIIVSVSGSGQISASNQIDLKPKTSGNITYLLGAKEGQSVKAGTIIARIDTTAAVKSIRDAQSNLDSAILALAKLNQPADQLSLLQAQNSLLQANESKQNAQDDLEKAYDDGFNTVSNSFLDLPTIMSELEKILFDKTFNPSQQNIDWYANQIVADDLNVGEAYKNDVYISYNKARQLYDENLSNYKSASRLSDKTSINQLISQTYETTKYIAEAIKNIQNYIDYVKDVAQKNKIFLPAGVDDHRKSITVYIGQTNSNLISLLSTLQTIKNSESSIVNAQRSIDEKTQSLKKLQASADPLDIQSQELTIKQRQNALSDAKQALNDYSVVTPFDGVLAALNAKKGDTASPSTAIATLVTSQQIAEISLNEVDAAKIKIGQKTTLTLDALPDLTITGQVAEIETVGTVSQGVVSYLIKITLDTQDNKIKPGMSASASIITDSKQNVLLVPLSAIKQKNNSAYVEIPSAVPFSNTAASISGTISNSSSPQQQNIQTGLSNDTMIEITEGLNEGDMIITQTINSSQTQTSSSQNSGLKIPGLTGSSAAGGGSARFNQDGR